MNITANQPYTTMKGYKGANIAISLNKINYVNIDKATKTCRVGAGCYLGKNPDDPSSTWENSLLQQLYDAGLGLTVLGGISHQSVAGFLLTGSAGGSLYHATSDMVIGFTFVDGQGNVRTCSETENPEWFAAMGVSMGLLGIVTEVQLQCVDNFNIIEEYHVKVLLISPILGLIR
jgi:D-arabinono-1,4-lactone oxidase